MIIYQLTINGTGWGFYETVAGAKRGAQKEVETWINDWEPEDVDTYEEVLTDKLVWEMLQHHLIGPPAKKPDKKRGLMGEPVWTAFYSKEGCFTIYPREVQK